MVCPYIVLETISLNLFLIAIWLTCRCDPSVNYPECNPKEAWRGFKALNEPIARCWPFHVFAGHPIFAPF